MNKLEIILRKSGHLGWPFFLSLLGHFICLMLIFFGKNYYVSLSQKSRSGEKSFEVVNVEQIRQGHARLTSSRKMGAITKGKKRHNLELKDLKLDGRMNLNFNAGQATLAGDSVSGESQHSMFKTQSVSITNEIYKAIFDRLDYPQELIDKNIQGIVNVELVIAGNGEGYCETKSKIRTNSNYLKVVVAQALRRALNVAVADEKVKRVLTSVQKTTKYSAVFNFQISTTQEVVFTNKISDNTFFFYKYAYGGNRPIDLVYKSAFFAGTLLAGGIISFDFLNLRPLLYKTDYEKGAESLENRKLQKYKDDPSWGEVAHFQ